MVKVTILGSGVTGMMAAAKLPRDYDITVVAEHMPGDYDTKEWASPWAGAIWVGVHQSKPEEQKMQLEGFAGLWKLAETNPESSIRQIEMTEIMDRGSKSDVWYAGKLPEFRFLSKDELPKGAIYGMKYKTLVLTPQIFLLWLHQRLTDRGVKFIRTKVNSLADLKGLGHDVLINASGLGSEKLRDVQEKNLVPMRLQCVVAKADNYDRLFIRRGENGYYSTAFSRRDGTVYVGGVLKEDSRDLTVSEEQRTIICRNAHLNQPDVFPSPDAKDWPILYDHVGVYPVMNKDIGGVRCEKEVLDGQRVIHAYGQNAGGYVYSFGLARAVINLVDEFLFEIPQVSKL
ncbi:FAD dependent oxidoreductase [Ilyonectria sp. MPI-CAGE-AT-0026]|nr:FAD dependent oxidoreductase [Ilyonectria sp. MPI-CAGE-AT-0026]